MNPVLRFSFCFLLLASIGSSTIAQTGDPDAVGVDPESCIVVHLNLEKIFGQIDHEDELLKTVQEKIESLQPVQLDQLQRLLVTMSATSDGDAVWTMPYSVTGVFQTPVSRSRLIETNNTYYHWKFVPDESMGDGVYVSDVANARTAFTAFYFPSDRVVVNASRGVINRVVSRHAEDASPGATLLAQTDPSAEFHLIIDGQRVEDFRQRRETLEINNPTMLNPPVPGFENFYEALDKLEIVVDLQQMLPVAMTISMMDEKSAVTVEQMFQALKLSGPGLLDAARENLDLEDPDTKSFGEFPELFEFGKLALQEMDVSREESVVYVQLSDVEGLDRVPQWAVKLAAMAWQLESRAKEAPDGTAFVD